MIKSPYSVSLYLDVHVKDVLAVEKFKTVEYLPQQPNNTLLFKPLFHDDVVKQITALRTTQQKITPSIEKLLLPNTV